MEDIDKAIIVDLEYLSPCATGVILSMGIMYCEFDNLPENVSEVAKLGKHFKYDTKEQIQKYGKTIAKSTIDWWNNQSDEAKKILKPNEHDLSILNMIDHVNDYLKSVNVDGKKCIWLARGMSDIPKLEHTFRSINKLDGDNVFPWSFWNQRCTKSLLHGLIGASKIDIPDEWKGESMTVHDALDDCAIEALRFKHIRQNMFE